jgi:MinD-like ATPase involved in chromosome partitioning or flagellar assembly
MTQITVVTLAGDPEREAMLADLLNLHSEVNLLLRCLDRVELLASIRGGGLDAMISVGAPAWLDAQSAGEALRAGVRIVGVVDDPLEERRLSSLGAAVLPSAAPLEEIIERCSADPIEQVSLLPSAQPANPTGKLIAVWGPKGAPGRTTVAVELAAELASTEASTLLVDGDFYGGDVLQLFGITEELPTVVWAARLAANQKLDGARLALDLRRAGSDGPVVLPGLPRAELWTEVSDFGWRQLLEVVGSSFRFTVCDVGFCLEQDESPFPGAGEGRNRAARVTVREAHQIVAVCRCDPVGIKNFIWSFPELRDLAADEDILVVANQVRSSDIRDVSDLLRRNIGRRPIAYIPRTESEVARAVREGTPIREQAPGSDVCMAVRALAAAVGGHVVARGFLGRLVARA